MTGRRYLSSAPALADAVAKWRNPAAMLYGAKDLRFEELPMADEVAPGDVRVQMKAVGICGSDVHFLKNVRMRALADLLTTTCVANVAPVKHALYFATICRQFANLASFVGQ